MAKINTKFVKILTVLEQGWLKTIGNVYKVSEPAGQTAVINMKFGVKMTVLEHSRLKTIRNFL